MARMEVLVLGLCRTGTMSMKLALEELGYKKVYHFFEIPANPTHTNIWIRAMEEKYGKPSEGNPDIPKGHDFRTLFVDYDALTDIPSVCFAPELMAIYPHAKLILTTRTPFSWLRSMLQTIHPLVSSRFGFYRLSVFFSGEHEKSLFYLLGLIIECYFHGNIAQYGPQVFEEHNELVRKLAAEGRREFLEFQLGDGWGPLCEFLGKEVPEVDYPNVNNSESFRRSFSLGCNWISIVIMFFLAILLLSMGIKHTVIWINFR